MNLRNQPRINYNLMQEGDIPNDEASMLLNINISPDGDDVFDFEEVEFEDIDPEYMFLHDTLGWGEGPTEQQKEPALDPERHKGGL